MFAWTFAFYLMIKDILDVRFEIFMINQFGINIEKQT